MKTSSSLSSVDSGLDGSTKKRLKQTMSVDYNKQLEQAGTLTAKTQKLKEQLINSNKSYKSLLQKKYHVGKSEDEMDSDDMIPPSQFSPLAFSTQSKMNLNILDNQVIKCKQEKLSDSSELESSTLEKDSKMGQPLKLRKEKNVEFLKRNLSLKNVHSVEHNEEDSDSSIPKGKVFSKQLEQNSARIQKSSEGVHGRIHQKIPAKSVSQSISKNYDSNESDDDSSSNEIPEYNNKVISDETKEIPHSEDKVSNFLRNNPEYTKIQDQGIKEIVELDSEDEVYILQIPKTVIPHIRQGLKFSLQKKTKIKTSSGKYFIKPQTEIPSSLLVYSKLLKRITPRGLLKMEKYVKVKNQNEVFLEESKPKILPENIKTRHPLFGSDYKSKIHLEEQIKEKLRQALQRFEVQEKSPKKVKKNKKEEEDKCVLISQILEEKIGRVGKSASRNSFESSSIQKTHSSQEFSFENGEQSKKKKKHRITEGVNSVEDGKSINVNNIHFLKQGNTEDLSGEVKQTKKSKLRRNSISVKVEVESEDDERSEESQNKNKKHTEQEIDEEQINDEGNLKKKKKKSKRNRSIEKELVAGTSMEVAVEEQVRKKKKKHKIQETEQVASEHSQDSIDTVITSKNKKKKFMGGDNLIVNVKKEVVSESEHENDAEIRKQETIGSQVDDGQTPRKNKKKTQVIENHDFVPVRVKQEKETPDNSDQVLEEMTVNFVEPTSKKRRKSILSSTMVPNCAETPDFKLNISKIESDKSLLKKMKKKNVESDNSKSLINSLLSTIKDEITGDSGLKTKKKKHR